MGWPRKNEEMRIYKDRGDNGYMVIIMEDFQRSNYGAVCNVYDGPNPSLGYADVARSYITKQWLKRQQWSDLPLEWMQAIARYMNGGRIDGEAVFDPNKVRGFWKIGNQPTADSGFQEITYVHSRNSEAYVHIQGDEKVIDVYTNKSSLLIDQTSSMFRWKKGENPLFLHAEDPEGVFDFMNLNGWVTNDE